MNKKFPILISGDAVISAVAICAGFLLRFWQHPSPDDVARFGFAKVAIFSLVVVFSSFFVELYNEKNMEKKEVAIKGLTAVVISFFILSSLYYMMPSVMFGRGILALSLAAFALLQIVWHISVQLSFSLPRFTNRILILGTGPLAIRMGGVIASMENQYVLAGYFSCTDGPADVPLNSIIGKGEGLIETAHRQKAHKIVVSLSERRGSFPLRDVLDCKLGGIEVVDAPSFYEQATGKLLIENITPSWFIFSDGFRITTVKLLCKRALDLFFAAAVLIPALPLIPLIALLIKLDSKGPVFFKQVRVGRHGDDFTLYKFRTMRQDAEDGTGAVWSQKNDPRITRLGKFLRTSRLDEIPQLYNVLMGEMGLVGPRPERPEFVEKLKEAIPYYGERHSIKPGITGWAQIKYPYGSSVEDAIEKLRYDLFYIKHFSSSLDLLILLETIKVILSGRGGR